jgi:uncharacterized protein YbjT (DUF2867 family)
MAGRKIIAVVGGTGAQGGGLARAILNDPSGAFSARILTRRPRSAPAAVLAQQGAEIVAADLDDPASVQNAFTGAFGAFCVTNFASRISGNISRPHGRWRKLARWRVQRSRPGSRT